MTALPGGVRPPVAKVRRVMTSLIYLLCIAVAACAPWRDNYFDDGVGVLTQSDVKGKLGKPHMVKDPWLSNETTWTYRYAISESELDPSGVKSFGKQAGDLMGGPKVGAREKVYCFMYVLTFDKAGILRHWEREICQIPKPPDPFQKSLSG